MSIVVSNCNQICNSPLNNSTSKMLYSFPKQHRFVKRKQILCDKFYDANSNKRARTTNFGFGNKYDFTRDASCSPPSNTYNLIDQFKTKKNKGFGFGKGRQEMEITGPFVASKKNRNPGPGTYALPSMLQKNSFAFKSKLTNQQGYKKLIPGPGTYPVAFNINQKGKYFLAKYKNSCVRDFGKCAGRISNSSQNFPGPGSYSTHGVQLSPKGKYVTSKIHNCLTRTFGSSGRKFFDDKTNIPGPGNYRLPSEFGYYDSKKNVYEKVKTEAKQLIDEEDNKVAIQNL